MGRVWTLADANEALPMVRGLLADARRHLSGLRAAQDQLLDLRTLHGDGVMAVGHEANGDWRSWGERHEEAQASLVGVLAQFEALGIEPKDIDQGLIDFRGKVGAREAYLCWKEPEEQVTWWHPLDTGFGGRRAIPVHRDLSEI